MNITGLNAMMKDYPFDQFPKLSEKIEEILPYIDDNNTINYQINCDRRSSDSLRLRSKEIKCSPTENILILVGRFPRVVARDPLREKMKLKFGVAPFFVDEDNAIHEFGEVECKILWTKCRPSINLEENELQALKTEGVATRFLYRSDRPPTEEEVFFGIPPLTSKNNENKDSIGEIKLYKLAVAEFKQLGTSILDSKKDLAPEKVRNLYVDDHRRLIFTDES